MPVGFGQIDSMDIINLFIAFVILCFALVLALILIIVEIESLKKDMDSLDESQIRLRKTTGRILDKLGLDWSKH